MVWGRADLGRVDKSEGLGARLAWAVEKSESFGAGLAWGVDKNEGLRPSHA